MAHPILQVSGQNNIGKFDYCSKVDEPSTNAKRKKGICVRICSKFSFKCEENHKTIVIVDFLMLVAFKWLL